VKYLEVWFVCFRSTQRQTLFIHLFPQTIRQMTESYSSCRETLFSSSLCGMCTHWNGQLILFLLIILVTGSGWKSSESERDFPALFNLYVNIHDFISCLKAKICTQELVWIEGEREAETSLPHGKTEGLMMV